MARRPFRGDMFVFGLGPGAQSRYHFRPTPVVFLLVASVLTGAGPWGGTAHASQGEGRIGFSSERSGLFQLYSMLQDGSDVQVVSPAGASHLDWSPDGSKIAYEQAGTLYVAQADGSNAAAITSGFRPAWSPDGLHLAFALNNDIWRAPVDGSSPATQLTTDGASCSDDGAAWSPDGSSIAYQGCAAGDPEIFVMDAGGGPATRLTDSPGIDWYPAWSPDGTTLAFTTFRDGNPEIYVMNADGSSPTRLTSVPGGDEFPSWSPDGTKIAFASNRDGNFEIYVMNADGSGISRLTNVAGRDFFPDWQPVPQVVHTLTVTVAGSGAGTVTSDPVGIDCGSDCTEGYAPGTQVTLTASPGAGSSVAGWMYPGCSGPTCVVTMDQARTVAVTFDATPPPATHLLTIEFAVDTGLVVPEGHVTSEPAGLVDCTETCSVSLPEGTSVTLSAGADPGYFTGWSGEGCKGILTCAVTVDQDRTVTASFSWISAVVLTQQVTLAGTGSGSVISQPAGIDCPPTCQAEFTLGDTVTLTADPAEGSVFERWIGACESTQTTCSVLIDAAQVPATAVFATTGHELGISIDGSGSGAVASDDGGIACPGDCSETYDPGEEVVLTASADAGSSITGWSGGGCAGAGTTCTLTMDQVRSVTVTFTRFYVLTTARSGAGTGVVSVLPLGVMPDGSIAAGDEHTCAIRTDGTATCWGWNAYGQADVPSGRYSMISAGAFRHTCAIRTDGTATCWGFNDSGQTDAPSGNYSVISAGGHHTCAIRANGTATCWGENGYGQTGAPSGTYSKISAGDLSTCAIRTDGTATCWGHNGYGQAEAPSGTYSMVSTGSFHTCGIRTDGTATCWGHNGDGQAEAPSGTYSMVSTGTSHTCAIRTDGTATCWGDNVFGQADAPAGTFSAISSGEYHTCGIRTDGTATCWGRNYYGQADPPPETFLAQGCLGCSVYPAGTVVTVTALADEAASFAGFGGDCSGTGPCTVTMDQDRSVTATFALDAVNARPSANSQLVTTNEDEGIQIMLTGSDPDHDPLTCEIWYLPEGSSLDDCTLVWVPQPNVFGTDYVYFRVSDGDLLSEWALVTIEVRPVGDIPKLDIVSVSATTEGQTTSYTIYFRDPDGQPSADFVGSISWGDGTSSTSLTAQHYFNDLYYFDVSHTYERFGKYTQTLAVRDASGLDSYKRGQTVQDAAIYAADMQGGSGRARIEWPPGGVVGCVIDANPNGLGTDLSASVRWGDGKSSTGTVVANTKKNDPNDACSAEWDFLVRATHAYQVTGCFRLSYTLTSKGGSKTTGRHLDCVPIT